MIVELEDLLATIGDATDRTTLEAILEKNPATKQLTIDQRNLYKAFVDNDAAAINAADQAQREAAARAAAAARTNPNPSVSSNSVGLTLDQLDSELDKRLTEKFKPQLEAQASYIEQVATKAAQAVADKLGPQLLAQSIGTADTIYSIRTSHMAEFGEPLDTVKFNEFVQANQGKYADLTSAHDAFVQKQRVDKQIADGIAAGRLADQTNDVPGTTLAKSDSMAGRFVAKNTAAANAARGDGLDAATAAFRQLRQSHAE